MNKMEQVYVIIKDGEYQLWTADYKEAMERFDKEEHCKLFLLIAKK